MLLVIPLTCETAYSLVRRHECHLLCHISLSHAHTAFAKPRAQRSYLIIGGLVFVPLVRARASHTFCRVVHLSRPHDFIFAPRSVRAIHPLTCRLSAGMPHARRHTQAHGAGSSVRACLPACDTHNRLILESWSGLRLKVVWCLAVAKLQHKNRSQALCAYPSASFAVADTAAPRLPRALLARERVGRSD